ncbi:MAG: hypothetical protein CMJ48_12915 [Planctomycetaceae bacterium]|nr:hypothetical protein [Planctomycetaceae bacterium]
MKCQRLTQSARSRSFHVQLTTLALIGALSVAGGCVLKTGVGDSKTSKVDSKLVGYWINSDDHQLVTVVPFDDATYLVDWMAYSGSEDSPQPRLRVLNKAWVAKVDDERYATFEMLVPPTARTNKFLVMQLQVEDDSIVLRQLQRNIDDFLQADTSEELVAAIRKHREDANAFSAGTTFKKATAAQSSAIRTAFHSGIN